MRRPLLAKIVLLAFALLPIEASAWNKPGHMVTGAIAYNELKQLSPGTIPLVVSLLEQHPFYLTMWKPRIDQLHLSGDDRDRFLFVFAARWPDDARDTPFHHELWHFINFPFKPPNQPPSVKTQKPKDENVIAAFKLNLQVLRTAQASKRDKAIALCWVFHLVGDVHQPLHTTALFSTVFPNGDRGGNLWFIKFGNGQATKLHAFWDGLILDSEDFQAVSNRAIQLRGNPDLARTKLAELSEKNFEKWANPESFAAAVQVAYRGGMLPASNDENHPATMPGDYLASAKQVAQRRNILAGYRLADLLPSLVGQH